ncbi:hypothetical protein ACF044_16580 [Microbacterium sp. NPDC016588]|uniref:hypothetical protein n=1 Tax=unclassified Microbacterium TaxID=2609290 RepID=UPI0007F47EB3|nr:MULTISPECIES: hypothetical protein [unclassified Microbacterium]OAN36190.1 hypothetical protein A4X16_17140 [Microbacterium sp. H83]TCJ20578.1 hypothetical protein E0W80_18960 [Microbacterium sp. PI-1]
MSLRNQIIEEFKARNDGQEPSGSYVRLIERHRVSELEPTSDEARRIRGDMAEREAITAEALRRWFSIRHEGLPIPMPSVTRLEHEVRQERAAAR